MTAANTTLNRGVGFSQTLTNALKSVKLTSVFPASLIGQQLQTVAEIISIQSQLGVNRQIFFCQLKDSILTALNWEPRTRCSSS